jgi:nitrilase
LNENLIKVAVVQAAPVMFDRQACVDKACLLIREAASHGAELVLFPEAFIPAYPRGFSFGAVVGSRSSRGRDLWELYWSQTIEIPGSETVALGKAAREANVYLAIGVVERGSRNRSGTLYCSLLYFNHDGKLLGAHRKLKPTASERLIWGEGDGSDLYVFDTDIGKLGGLICWENYMPLARMAMYTKGVEIYLAPTADARDSWQATLQHIACEGRCFVLVCNQYLRRDMYPKDMPLIEEIDPALDVLCRGGSVIISPFGELLAGPLYDGEGILYAELTMSEIARGKFDFDVVGHYARPDVFKLIIDERPKPGVENLH